VVRIALNANISWRNRRREVVADLVFSDQGRQGRCEMDFGPGGTLSRRMNMPARAAIAKAASA
jgi:hypothetical protein